MKILPLFDDLPGREDLFCGHGLSLYIETPSHRLLFDTGAGEKTLSNAKRLGIEPKALDAAVISHGHYDHADGLLAFAEAGFAGKIYLARGAEGRFFHGEKPIGADPRVFSLGNLVRTADVTRIDEELTLFSTPAGREARPGAAFTRHEGNAVLPDDFSHEQSLAVFADGRKVLFIGCAHAGVCRILARYRALFSCEPDLVVGGFHFPDAAPLSPEAVSAIDGTAIALRDTTTARFATGHCTGGEAFSRMRALLGDRLSFYRIGEEIGF